MCLLSTTLLASTLYTQNFSMIRMKIDPPRLLDGTVLLRKMEKLGFEPRAVYINKKYRQLLHGTDTFLFEKSFNT